MLRREFLKLAGASALTMLAAPAIARDLPDTPELELDPVGETDQLALAPMPRPTLARSVFIAHAHSNEHFDGVFWQDGRYIDSALAQLNFLFRDRTGGGAMAPIAPGLIDLLCDLGRELKTADPFLLVSGYRKVRPVTVKGRGGKLVKVDSSHSLHPDGKAIDIRMPGRNLNQVRKVAVAMKRGGVGFYGGGNGHLHLDVGPVRSWG